MLSQKDRKIVELLAGMVTPTSVHSAAIIGGGKILSVARCEPNTRHAETNALYALPEISKITKSKVLFRQHAGKITQPHEYRISYHVPTAKKRKYDLYVIKYAYGRLCNSKPCKHCIDSIRATGLIRRVIYTDKNGNLVRESIDEIENNHVVGIHKYTRMFHFKT